MIASDELKLYFCCFLLRKGGGKVFSIMKMEKNEMLAKQMQ